MTQKPKKASWPKAAVILLLLLAAIFFFVRANTLNLEYTALAAITPAPTLAPPNLAYRELAPLYRYGSVGPEVIALQERLLALGYYTGEVDGKYYEGTQAAVKNFQLQHGLDADGIAGTITLEWLNKPDAKPYDPAFFAALESPSPTTTPGGYVSPAPTGTP